MPKPLLLVICLLIGTLRLPAQEDLEAYLGYPAPANLTSHGDRIAWTFNEKGKRNIFVAEAPGLEARQLTAYDRDDGQEITGLAFAANGASLVYVRGGEHGSNWAASKGVNPASRTLGPGVQLWSIPFAGGKPALLASGSYPKVSPNGDQVVFLRSGKPWIVPLDGSSPAKKLFADPGSIRHMEWSPDGKRIAFTSHRGTHSFIGVYGLGKKTLEWVAPSFSKDTDPKWSPDGRALAFVRRPGSTKMRDSLTRRRHQPWEIRIAQLGEPGSRRLWKAPETLRGSVPTTHGRFNLHWAKNDRLVFLSQHDGWPHLYSIAPKGGKALLLTPGAFMVEEIRLDRQGERLLFSANTGKDPEDRDRRHIARVSTHRADMELLTQGQGVESSPVFLEKGVAFLSSTHSRPALPAVLEGGKIVPLALDRLPADLPQHQMVRPRQVIFKAPDGTRVHGQWFEKGGGKGKKPALVFVHGGPQRQMLLAWDHRGYYAQTYALNQYLAHLGYVVLSVNYRLGIGYGHEFHKPEGYGRYGASEYQDILAAGKWLAGQPQVDPTRIGIYGGSYGGYLTALALGRNSDVFAAGVDIHGVHSRVPSLPYNAGSEKAPDAALADALAWESSPIAHVGTWTSPVLLIHGDDDRNVGFHHSVDLAQRLAREGVYFESLALPNETHHWMLHRNLVTMGRALVKFLGEQLK